MANFKQEFSLLSVPSFHCISFSLSPLFLCCTLPLFSVLHFSRLHRLLTGWLCSVSIRPAGCSSNSCGGSSCSGSLQWQVSVLSWTLFFITFGTFAWLHRVNTGTDIDILKTLKYSGNIINSKAHLMHQHPEVILATWANFYRKTRLRLTKLPPDSEPQSHE